MATPSGVIADAIRQIEETAVAAASIHAETIDAQDGDTLVSIPVIGVQDPKSLLDVQKQAFALAREVRLSSADGPDRRAGTAVHQSIQSFIDHVKRFQSTNSAVWADAAASKLVSVLDYHPAGSESPARWGKHRGVYGCPLSEQWKAWGSGAPLVLDQDRFAAFLDARDRELVVGDLPNGTKGPSPAALITFATNLEVFSRATAKRERDPQTGRLTISYAEEKGVSGSVFPPPSFLIRIPIFQDGEPTVLEVRLRVDVADGAAKFTTQIHAAGDVLRDAFAELCERVATEAAVPVFVGTPE